MSQTENNREFNKRLEMRCRQEDLDLLDKQRGLVSRGAYIRHLIRNAHMLPPVPGFTAPMPPTVSGGHVQLRLAPRGESDE